MLAQRHIADIQWGSVADALLENGFGRIGNLLSRSECCELRGVYAEPERFRSRIEMERFRFGRGEYQYFRYPLPELVSTLRHELYDGVAPLANEWMAALRMDSTFPHDLESFLRQCRARGQSRPTPLLLRYRAGDFNCLHQDIYGELTFPFQVILSLSDPVTDYSGGELLLIEQRPRAQSRGHVIQLAQGEGVVITTRFRPVKNACGTYRANVRHGVSTVTAGERFTLGIIFHDSK